ncbi:MAG TPA: dihydrodipicolinate synthase family protein, partial [Casimicrobiaceae bacterium]|nr:dihydrodipicolinate synthase family protein [Casimicrobiaceae bacterium]
MTSTDRPRGVLAPVVTPFTADLAPDARRLVRHCRWLLDHDVGLAVFGTNSEANSMSVAEKIALLDALVEARLPPSRLMPGTGCCALTDTVELTRRAMRHGCAGVLMLPPFYYKKVTDEGLFASYAEVIERVGDARLRIYLYHIPQVSQVPITLSLIERLLARFPGTIAGIKDSSGDFANTRAMLERFQPQGFDVFAGSESFLLATLEGGGAGCISAVANVNAPAIARLAREWQRPDANAQQEAVDRVRTTFLRFAMPAALKTAIAHFAGDEEWKRMRPPLVALTTEQRTQLVDALRTLGFAMPGITQSAA